MHYIICILNYIIISNGYFHSSHFLDYDCSDALLYFYDLKSIRVDLFKAITSTLSDSDEKHEAETILANGVSLSHDNHMTG